MTNRNDGVERAGGAAGSLPTSELAPAVKPEADGRSACGVRQVLRPVTFDRTTRSNPGAHIGW